jgi:hypothetical protein
MFNHVAYEIFYQKTLLGLQLAANSIKSPDFRLKNLRKHCLEATDLFSFDWF